MTDPVTDSTWPEPVYADATGHESPDRTAALEAALAELVRIYIRDGKLVMVTDDGIPEYWRRAVELVRANEGQPSGES